MARKKSLYIFNTDRFLFLTIFDSWWVASADHEAMNMEC
jgi:hypothetical protein